LVNVQIPHCRKGDERYRCGRVLLELLKVDGHLHFFANLSIEVNPNIAMVMY
jgi:hypothetical protein